jgi:lantibiotic leader peptide-processing serine protease
MGRGLLRFLACASAGLIVLTLAATAPAVPPTSRYVVVLKEGRSAAGLAAVKRAGGRLLAVNKIGIATVDSSKPSFASRLRASGAILGVANDAAFRVGTGPKLGLGALRGLTRAAVSTPATEAAACAALYSVPATTGPDPLAACQWDMRAIKANPGSYDVTKGAGARIGDIDTGIDLTSHEFNLDLATSCSFIYATTPTSDPSEQVPVGDCSNKNAVQDLAGHGTHTAGIMAAKINGHGTSGVAPDATIVALKAGTEGGFFFTDSVVNSLVYAGDHHLDVANMSFFADPWLFNCRNDAEQKAIIQAISRAAKYAQSQGVVLVAAAGNDGIDMNHPTVDEISPDYPPGAATTRPVNNSCVVMPTEIAGVVVVTATGAQNLLAWYSTYGNVTDVTAPGGSRFQTTPLDPNRGRVLAPYSSTASDLAAEDALGRLVQDPGNGDYYAWLNGTSMAAPHVAGVVGLIRAQHPNMSVGAVVSVIRGTATAQGCPAALDPGVVFFGAPEQFCKGGAGSNNFYGKGLLNALAAASR